MMDRVAHIAVGTGDVTEIWSKDDGSVFTDAEWTLLIAEVPDQSKLAWLRMQLEAAGGSYRKSEAARLYWTQEASVWTGVETHARRLMAVLPSEDASWPDVDRLLNRAIDRARSAQNYANDEYERILLGKNAKLTDVPKLILYKSVLDAWAASGGKVSRTYNDKRQGGSCVRFLLIVLPAIMGDKAPVRSSLQEIIERWQAANPDGR